MPTDRLGGFEELVLLATASLRGAGYGVTIQEAIEAETGQTVAVGAVYATLDRLERKGLVTSREGSPTRERGGRRTRLFRVSAAGMRALSEMQRIRGALREAIEAKPS